MNGTSTNDDTVDVIVPLSPRHASTLRTMAATLGADTGFSIDEIDDFKLAITEAFSMLVSGYSAQRARVSFTGLASAVDVRMSLETGDAISIEPDELALAIMKAVVDSYQIGRNAISLRKVAVEAFTPGAGTS
ncbi:MAG: hypothetical protein ABL953_10175 [Ilumatobacteraceae bacterium]